MKESEDSSPPAFWTQLAALVLFVGITALAATAGAMASVNASSFYGLLAKPAWAPPAGLFGPVWTVLYILMAIAAWLVWRVRGMVAGKGPLVLYLVQLALNALWTWLFFRWRLGAWALAEIVILWLILIATLTRFWRVHPLAGVLLLPYLAWVTFATALTAAVWRLNPGLL